MNVLLGMSDGIGRRSRSTPYGRSLPYIFPRENCEPVEVMGLVGDRAALPAGETGLKAKVGLKPTSFVIL